MKKNLRNRYVFSAVFAAMIAVSGFFIIPMPGGVPIVLKNLFVVLSGTVLGSFYGCISVLVFIAAGLIGVPVFVIPGGPAVFLTPLGGFIAGYFFASLFAGIICGLPKVNEKGFFVVLKISIASFSGFALILICGVFYMMHINSISLSAAITAGVLPFLAGDIIKLSVSIPLAVKLRPIAARYING